MSVDFWDDASNEDVPEPPKPSFAGIPDGLTLIVRTTDRTDKDTIQPSIKEVDYNDQTFYKFKIPTVIVGGDAKLDPKYVGWKVFLELNIERPTVEQLTKAIATATANDNKATVSRLEGQLKALDKYPCAPELYNLMLDTLAPEEGKAGDRWAAVKAVLATKGRELGYTPEMFKGNVQYLYAETFRQVLLASQYQVIGKTYTPKQRPGKTYQPQQTLGSIGSDTVEQRKSRKVALIAAKDEAGDF